MTIQGLFTTKEVSYPHYNISSYRIEIDQRVTHQPVQRHIWTYQDGTEKIDGWIPTSRLTQDDLNRGWTEVEQD